MESNEQTITTATDAEGHTYIAEIDSTLTTTSADGTESVAEITTTADPDNPTEVEGHMTVTATAPDGTETVTEFVAKPDGSIYQVEEESALEAAFEELFGVEIADDLIPVDEHGQPIENADAIESDGNDFDGDVYLAESDDATMDVSDAGDFTDSEAVFESEAAPFDTSAPVLTGDSIEPTETESADSMVAESPDQTFADAPVYEASANPSDETSGGAGVIETPESADANATSESDAAANQELIEQQAHADAATEAQQAADDFVERGDYAAAADAREVAENEAWEAGDNSMLSVYDAQDLQNAADKQEDAAYYEGQEAAHAQAGDYEAAREDAANAGYAISDADFSAGGADHSGQADSEYANMDNAVWHEKLADDQLDNAAWYAENGNADAAESALDAAAAEQATADDFGNQGEHGSVMADYDPSAEVETGGAYESSFDDHLSAVDTGYDAGADMAVDTGFDAGAADTSMDSGYDAGVDDV